MAKTTLQRITELRTAIQSDTQELATLLRQELAIIHTCYGFSTVEEFATAIHAAIAESANQQVEAPVPDFVAIPIVANRKAKRSNRKPRTVITDAVRADVKHMAEKGKTGAEIAKALKISVPSVQNIKRALGMVSPRKKAA